MENGTRYVSSVAVSCAPQVDSRCATSPDRWTSFLQLYEPFITRELTQQHPQFARALRQLERDSRLEQERQSAQVLATLRLKDARISELQKVVREQHEQLDVVLDELERRETKEDKGVQVDEERQKEDASLQTESVRREIETQTEKDEEESGVLVLLEKLEKELKMLEEKNLILERELQQKVLKSEDVTEDNEELKNCLEILQQGVDAMNLSCGCVDNPLAYFVGMSDKSDGKDFVAMSACVNLEHRLEAQAVRLEHAQECLYLWRDTAVQMMKRQNEPNRVVDPMFSPSLKVRHEKEDSGEVTCSVALRGALSQIRQNLFQRRGNNYNDSQYVLKELANVLAKGKRGAKIAAKMVRKWARWEAKHLEEVRALRQGFNEECVVAQSRRAVLLKRIALLEQRKLELQAEVNALKKKYKFQDGKNTTALTAPSPTLSANELLIKTDTCGKLLEYPQLALRLATAEQSLLAKDEQLTAANNTIRALSSAALTSTHVLSHNTLIPRVDVSMNHLGVELERASKQKLDFFQRREKDLVSLGQYFRMEKLCLQLQSRLGAQRKHAAMMKSAIDVCERERDELLMKVEKLETESMLAKLTHRSAIPSLLVDPHADNTTKGYYNEFNDAFFVALRRLQLVEDDRKILRERLRYSQQQVALMTQQRPENALKSTVEDQNVKPSAFDCVAEHHQKCVSVLKEFLDRQNSDEDQKLANDTARQPGLEWDVLLNHYEGLWIAFNFLYSFLTELSPFMETRGVPSGLNTKCGSVLRSFGCQVPAESNSHNEQENLETLEFELLKQGEKVLLLQEKLMNQEEGLHGYQYPAEFNAEIDCSGDQNHHNISSAEFASVRASGDPEIHNRLQSDTKQLSGTPFLEVKPHEGPFESDRMSSNGSGNETIQERGPVVVEKPMESCEFTGDNTAIALKECLAKCAYLSSQNTKLTRRLRAEKEANKQHLKEQEGLRTQLSARTDASSQMQQTLEQYQNTKSNVTSAGGNSSTAVLQHDESKQDIAAKQNVGIVSSPQTQYEQEYESLKDQLASREQENLTLVQSLCSIKEKCAQMEAIHQKELRVKAAEHAEGMENYMTTVNGTLSRIESDKCRLEEENIKLRSKLQQVEEESTKKKLEQTQRSTKSTNTNSEKQIFAYNQEKETLMARIQDLELQLARERKLTELVEQKKCLEQQQENQSKEESSKALQDYEMLCNALKEWRSKLEHEFADYQAIQQTSQQESDRRIEFLSACIEEYVRLADATSSSVGKTVTTNELHDAVIALARDPPRTTARGMASSLQNKMQATQSLSGSRVQKQRCSSQQNATPSRDDAWGDMLKNKDKVRSEPEISEVMWWKLRASKMDAYVRSAMLQNDTFEDTIRQLELGLRNVKEELSSRLAREAQLVSNLSSLKSELLSTKEQAAALAEKYQIASAELEKRQGEAASHGDETLRARMAVQRKTELLAQQKSKVASLQQQLEQAAKKVERLTAAEKQAALLQQKAKKHTQQLLHARQCYERCHDDNFQLSIHLEKMKERHVGVVARLKTARAENAQLRAQCAELKMSSLKTDPKGTSMDEQGKDNHRSNQGEVSAVSVASLTEEARALKRRVLQKQDMIVSYKAKITEYEAQLERQRETMVKLARTNRELQQGQFQRHQQELEHTSAIHARLESQFEMKREQLDGLRASVYDSFEAFVFCRGPAAPKSLSHSFTTSVESPLTDEAPEDDRIFEIKRWTDFSVQDLEELRLTRGPQRRRHKREDVHDSNNLVKQKATRAALREVETALEANPEDCRAEICELLQCLCS